MIIKDKKDLEKSSKEFAKKVLGMIMDYNNMDDCNACAFGYCATTKSLNVNLMLSAKRYDITIPIEGWDPFLGVKLDEDLTEELQKILIENLKNGFEKAVKMRKKQTRLEALISKKKEIEIQIKKEIKKNEI